MHNAVLLLHFGLLWGSAALLNACNNSNLDTCWDVYQVNLAHKPGNNTPAGRMQLLHSMVPQEQQLLGQGVHAGQQCYARQQQQQQARAHPLGLGHQVYMHPAGIHSSRQLQCHMLESMHR
jgi:hypothetical protein